MPEVLTLVEVGKNAVYKVKSCHFEQNLGTSGSFAEILKVLNENKQ